MQIYQLLNDQSRESLPSNSVGFQDQSLEPEHQHQLVQDGNPARKPLSTEVANSIAQPISKQFRKPRKRIQQSYTREFKLKVLEWWACERIEQSPTELHPGEPRAPLMREVSERYLVPITTLHNWRENQEKIVGSKKGGRGGSRGGIWCKWPEIEANLNEKYRKRRDERKAVRRSWLYRQARSSFQDCYPMGNLRDFSFSNGWFYGFLTRNSISLRFTTNISQKIPTDYLSAIISWLQFNRRNSQIRSGTADEPRVVGRYLLNSICNMDETPLPFEFLDGQTYADKGSKSVQVKASNSGWNKRQATIILAAFGGGKSRVRPTIIFRGKEKYEGSREQFYRKKREEETSRYHSGIVVRWNETAYANSELLVDWINTMLVPALPPGPRLLALDVAKFHSTEAVLSTLRLHNIVPSMIPPGCTSLIQPLDVSINKPFKDILRDILENLLDDYETTNHTCLRELSPTNFSSIAERRVLVTHAVGQAWEIFCEKSQESVVQTFRQLGLTLPIDGSCDDELSVKGISPSLLNIGD